MLLLNKKFDSKTWKTKPLKRKYFVRNIVKKQIAIGKTKEEIEKLFGMENNLVENSRWSYYIYRDFWNKSKDYVLALYFEDGKVARTEIECRYKQKFRVLI